MRGFAKSRPEKTMEMKFRKTGLARRLSQQNARIIFGGEKIASATKPAEGVVMEKLLHGGIILPSWLGRVQRGKWNSRAVLGNGSVWSN